MDEIDSSDPLFGDFAVGYALYQGTFGAFRGRHAGDAARPGLLRRFYARFMQARQRRADRALVKYFESRGRVLTDDTEREIMHRLMAGNGWQPRP
jgi:hypothetical protein